MKKIFSKIKGFFKIVKSAIAKIRDPWWRAKQNYIKYYDKLPIDEKAILLESQHGTQINGNIFYICKYLSENNEYSNYQIYVSAWGRHVKKFENILHEHEIDRAKIITYASDGYFKILASAKYLINDNTFIPNFIKKEGQIYLNTWHGTPLKTLGRKMEKDASGIGNAQKNFIESDYILFPNKATREAIMKDYMIENLAETYELYGGYPRNEVFFDSELEKKIRYKYNQDNVKVYAYMPTFRGTASQGGTSKNDAYLQYYLYELDKQLNEDEILYVNLHPIAKKNINFKEFKKIREFPDDLETYEFLSIADCLITDYSSVFFDFANTRRKIILFTYDREDYLSNRGTYFNVDTLPFPKVNTIQGLLEELRSSKNYSDIEFLNEFSRYENADASRKLCDFVIKGSDTGILCKKNTPNGKENVFLYVGNLAGNGITSSIRNLLKYVDLDKRNYYLSFKTSLAKKNEDILRSFPEKVHYFSIIGDMNLSVLDRVARKLFKERIITAKRYAKIQGRRLNQEWTRCYGHSKIDIAIQFTGYEDDMIILYSVFSGKNAIYSHNDMLHELKLRGNCRKDVLKYAYAEYDKVAMVTQDILTPNSELVGFKVSRCNICPNIIDYQDVIKKAGSEVIFDAYSEVFPSQKDALNILQADTIKFVSVGRFSPEKGHLRLLDAFKKIADENDNVSLVIIGGVSNFDYFNKTCEYVKKLKLEAKVALILKVSNPYAIMKKCDYFVLSSFYEGFGIVIAEADILGLPVISPGITGPRGFMKKYGGTLVEDSTEGIENGMRLMLAGKVSPMDVDYQQYNNEAVAEFEQMLSDLYCS